MLKRLLIALAALVVLVGAGLAVLLSGSQEDVIAERPDIPFAPLTDDALKDPDNPAKVFRVDFAKVENDFPLSRADLMSLTPASMLALEQEEVDQIYARLTPGPIPDGIYAGDLFFAQDRDAETGDLNSRLEQILGGFKGTLATEKVDLVSKIGRSLWKGKRFERDNRVLRNLIEDFAPLEPLMDDRDSLMTAEIAREGWLKYLRPTTTAWLLFPAKLYCGQSLLDSRREAVIIDYFYGDELEGYRASPDSLVGRHGLKIRDEIRMVRPGFYLGRAYVNRIFLLNFTLYNEEVAEAGAEAFTSGADVAEDCWTGEQVRQAAAQ